MAKRIEAFSQQFDFTTQPSSVVDNLRKHRHQQNSATSWDRTLRTLPCGSQWFSIKKDSVVLGVSVRFVVDNDKNAGVVRVQFCTWNEIASFNTVFTELPPNNNQLISTDLSLASLSVLCGNVHAHAPGSFYVLATIPIEPVAIALPRCVPVPFDLKVFKVSCCSGQYGYNNEDNVFFKLTFRRSTGTALNTLNKLHDSLLHADVTFKLKESSGLRAHRCVLATCSPVFKAMFDGNMFSESATGEVNMGELDEKVLSAALRFMYGKDLENIDTETYVELLVFAEKYEIPELKAACEQWLAQDTSMDVLELLAVADTNNASVLKEAVTKRIVNHPDRKKILNKASASTVVRTHADAFVELLLRM